MVLLYCFAILHACNIFRDENDKLRGSTFHVPGAIVWTCHAWRGVGRMHIQIMNISSMHALTSKAITADADGRSCRHEMACTKPGVRPNKAMRLTAPAGQL